MEYGFSKMSRAAVVALAMLTGAGGVSFAGPYGVIAPASAPTNQTASADLPLVNVRDSRIFRRGGDGGRWRGDGFRRGGWNRGDGWRRHGDRGWRRGGWRDNDRWRYGRRHNGNFFGGAALGLGLGLLAAPTYNNYYAGPRRVYRSGGGSHTQWCYNRYRSYRAYDNSFQPYNGGRQQCYSPYS